MITIAGPGRLDGMTGFFVFISFLRGALTLQLQVSNSARQSFTLDLPYQTKNNLLEPTVKNPSRHLTDQNTIVHNIISYIPFLFLLFNVTVGDKNIVLDTKYFSITYPDTNVATTEDPGLMFVKGMDLIYMD